ncbi:MAG: MBL fold metallo-hydrolase [Cyanophyceae cyanobacterium]
MKRRQFLTYGFAAAWGTTGLALTAQQVAAQSVRAPSLTIRSLGHTCFTFSDGAQTILSNPFNTLGCTAGYGLPTPTADLVTISSQLLDEGYVSRLPGNPSVLYQAGDFEFRGLRFRGVRTSHDRVGGRRFGDNIAWSWVQGGLRVLHLGGMAGRVEVEQQTLLGRPDVAIVPVGGGPKAFTAAEAKAAIELLRPKVVIPSHFRTAAADDQCEIEPLDGFLEAMAGYDVKVLTGDSLTLRSGDLSPEGTLVRALAYPLA